MTHKQIRDAYFSWRHRYYPFRETDDLILPLLAERIPVANYGWLKRTREALLLTTQMMAKRLNISRSSYIGLENSDAIGSIQLNTLSRAAEAMGDI